MKKSKDMEYVAKVGKEFTFAGAVDQLFEVTFSDCAASTKRNYLRDYQNHIFPLLGSTPIGKITKADSEKAVAAIAEKKTFEEKTLDHFTYLIRTMVETAVENGMCLNESFCPQLSQELPPQTDEVHLKRNRRSLTAAEERQLFQMVMCDPLQEGEKMGIALMFACGLRNSEACGLNYSDIFQMKSDPRFGSVRVRETTEGNTNEVKGGGKTVNAPRIIPGAGAIISLLMRRKEYIQRLVEEKKITLAPGKTVDDLPIVCRDDFTTRCSSGDLTAKGKEVLMQVVKETAILDACDREIEEEIERGMEGIEDKDPTAYLLRRNFATHLYHLGLTEEECQYIMGHAIQDVYHNRRDFSNDKLLLPIARKMAFRPLLNDNVFDTFELTEIEYQRFCKNVTEVALHTDSAELLEIEIEALEPTDAIRIVAMQGGKPIEVVYTKKQRQRKVSRLANVTRSLHKLYEK